MLDRAMLVAERRSCVLSCSAMIGVRRQTQIYLEGVSGRRPQVPLDAHRLEAAAQKRMRPEAFAYVAAGAGNEHTVAANRAAFDRWRIVPRMLRDVERRDTSVELFGQRLPSPFLLAPVGKKASRTTGFSSR